INPNETGTAWRSHPREAAVQLYLSSVEAVEADLVNARAAGLPVSLNVVPVSDWIDPDELAKAVAAVIQVDADNPASQKRFQKLAQSGATPLIAGAYDPPLSLVRSLVRSGAHDVIPLPISLEELEASLAQIKEELEGRKGTIAASTGKLVSFIKSVGGV